MACQLGSNKQKYFEHEADLPGNVMFGFNVTVGSYNLLELPKLCEWFDQISLTIVKVIHLIFVGNWQVTLILKDFTRSKEVMYSIN
jgi:hypothetical protein